MYKIQFKERGHLYMASKVKKVTVTMTPDTIERLEQLAYETHSSKSKAITDLIWAAKVKNTNVRGQISIDARKI